MLWSTGGLFIKWTSLSGLELSFGRSLLAAITVAIFTRREGFGLNRVTALASVLYAALLLLFVLATTIHQPEAAALLRKLMIERGLPTPPAGRTIESVCMAEEICTDVKE